MNSSRLWDTFYSHGAYIHKTLAGNKIKDDRKFLGTFITSRTLVVLAQKSEHFVAFGDTLLYNLTKSVPDALCVLHNHIASLHCPCHTSPYQRVRGCYIICILNDSH